ncbi:heparinase II/III domain-containing protein [Spirosoma areae]
MKIIGLYWRTVRHLTLRQVVYQLVYRLRGRARLLVLKKIPVAYFLTGTKADKSASWQNGTFTLLNQLVSFPSEIDWNYSANGKLWTYNLNYFDCLNQPDMPVATGLSLMQNFITQTDSLRLGLEPYPTSLRIVNWVHFLSRHRIKHEAINGHLFAQTDLLSQRLEYHLAGNHLLENGFSLLTGALYFRNFHWFRKATRLVRRELTKQILTDGGHDERSPMYHQLLLHRLLNLLLALRHDAWQSDPDFVAFLQDKATRMLNWLLAITFRNGDVPMANDAAVGMSPTTRQLQGKARQVLPEELLASAQPGKQALWASGYRFFRQARYELVADVGPVGPDCQPGHAHADTFSFVLYVDNCPIIVDSGTSTYAIGERRAWERSTAAHNTVEYAGTNSSEVWAGFRVGRRAQTTLLVDTETTLTAQHDGYRHLGILHERNWTLEPTQLRITDRLLNSRTKATFGLSGVARFYFHPTIQVQLINQIVLAGPVQLAFTSVANLDIHVTGCAVAGGFNKLCPASCVEITFINSLESTLTLAQ